MRLEQRFPELKGLHSNFCPAPDEQGVENVKKLYRDALGYEISTEEAYGVLARVMRFLWAINRPAQKTSPLPDGQATSDTVEPDKETQEAITSNN